MVWGLVVHLICDWPLQNDWMATHKASRRMRRRRVRVIEGLAPSSPFSARIERERVGVVARRGPWWDRHPAAYVHAAIHGAGMLLVFPAWAALAIAVSHLLIDTRGPVVWWSELVGQTQPGDAVPRGLLLAAPDSEAIVVTPLHGTEGPPLYDVGLEVRFWTDQVFHVAVVAVMALVVGA